MNKEQRLEICKVCKNRKLDFSIGLLCGLTNKFADFDDNCPDFSEDEKENKRIKQQAKNSRGQIFDLFFVGKHYYATPIIWYLNITMYAILAISSNNYFSIHPEALLYWGANFKPLTLHHEPWRILSSFFLHADIIHFFANSISLLIVGHLLEHITGPRKFLSIYFLLGIISSLTSLWFNDFNIAIGASGAIFGLYGILIILLPTKIVESKNKTALIIGVVSFTIYNLISGFTNVLPKSDMFVDNAAHLGGFTAGLIFGIILYPSIRWTSNIVLSIFTQIILIVSVLGGGYYLLDKIPDNTTIYMDTLNEFTENENEALFIFRLSSYKYVDSYKDEITDIGIKNWEKNIYLLENLQKKADLQGIYAEKVEAYIHYCELRITQYEVMIQMLEVEENDSLNTEFNQLKSKIDSIITNYPM